MTQCEVQIRAWCLSSQSPVCHLSSLQPSQSEMGPLPPQFTVATARLSRVSYRTEYGYFHLLQMAQMLNARLPSCEPTLVNFTLTKYPTQRHLPTLMRFEWGNPRVIHYKTPRFKTWTNGRSQQSLDRDMTPHSWKPCHLLWTVGMD
jgi:hypothetical protein